MNGKIVLKMCIGDKIIVFLRAIRLPEEQSTAGIHILLLRIKPELIALAAGNIIRV